MAFILLNVGGFFLVNKIGINAAEVMRQGHLTGSIEVGKFADLIILEKNLYKIPLKEIGEVRVIETVLEGNTVFRID